MSLKKITPMIKDSTFICVGENHNDYANHLKQLEIIKSTFAQKKNMTIGMEMFTKKHQQVIDDYIESKISEYEFLKKTEYFSEWGYDYRLYKDIIDFAKKNKIKIIGLNIENRIVRHVGRIGLKDLNSEDFNQIPGFIDFSNGKYKESLYDTFQEHGSMSKRNFSNFYFAQLIRDEHMSQTAYNYFRLHPDQTIVILAGNGHVENGNGIPSRIEKLSGHQCLKILIDSGYSPGEADYFVYTKSADFQTSPQLNVMLYDTKDKVIISAVMNQPESEKGKLLAKDQIVSLDGITIKTIADVRLFLFTKKSGEQIKITLLRDNSLIKIDYTLNSANEDDN
jgi:uncharacterized iron-regulated protein